MDYKIAFIVGQLGLGGSEQQLYHLLVKLDRSKFTPIVISLGPSANEYWTKPIRDLGVSLWHLDRSSGRIGRVLRIVRLLRREKVQMVHSWGLHTNPYSSLAGRLSGVPLRLSSIRGNIRSLFGNKLLSLMGCRGFDALVANSGIAVEQLHRSKGAQTPIRFVPNGVVIPEKVSQAERERLKAELGFSADHLLVGTIGRIDKNKNHQMLLNAYSQLAEKWKALRLVIIGEGLLKSQLISEAKRMGIAHNVVFTGSMPFASRYLPAMEISCLSSHSEGMPNLIMEASAAGVPIVSTRCGGSVELIDHGRTGYLVPVDDVAGMTVYLDRLLSQPDLRCHMGNEGRNLMIEKFSVDAMVAGMVQVYEEAFQGKGLA